MVKLAGPEEMKWPNKALYTYNVQEGDRFILDEKVSLTKIRTNSGTSLRLVTLKNHQIGQKMKKRAFFDLPLNTFHPEKSAINSKKNVDF